MRVLRTVALTLFVVLLLLPATVYSVAYFLANSAFGTQRALAALDGVLPQGRLSFSDIELEARPLDVHLHDFVLADARGEALGRVGHLEVGVDLQTMLSGRSRLDRLHVSDFDVRFAWDAEGRLGLAEALRKGPSEKPETPDAAKRRFDVRNLLLSNGNLSFSGPGWDVHLVGTECRGRLASGAVPEADLSCQWSAGVVHLTGPDGRPLALTFGAMRLGNILVRGENRLVVEDMRLESEGHVLEGRLSLERPLAPEAVPSAEVVLRGTLPTGLVALLSKGQLASAVEVDFSARLGADGVALELRRLALLDGATFPDGEVAGMRLEDVSLATGVDELTFLGRVHVDRASAGGTRLEGVGLDAAATVSLPGLDVAALAKRLGTEGGTAAQQLLASAPLRLRVNRATVARATGTRFDVHTGRAKDVEFTGTMTGGRLRVGELAAASALVGDLPLSGPVLGADMQLGLTEIVLSSLSLRTTNGASVALTGGMKPTLDGLTFRLPFRLDARLDSVPAAAVTAALPPATAHRERMAAALQGGVVSGRLLVEGDMRAPEAALVSSAQLTVARESDRVSVALSETLADAGQPAITPRAFALDVSATKLPRPR